MNLKEVPDEMKVRAFDLIAEKYSKESNIDEFGEEVQKILLQLREMYTVWGLKTNK